MDIKLLYVFFVVCLMSSLVNTAPPPATTTVFFPSVTVFPSPSYQEKTTYEYSNIIVTTTETNTLETNSFTNSPVPEQTSPVPPETTSYSYSTSSMETTTESITSTPAPPELPPVEVSTMDFGKRDASFKKFLRKPNFVGQNLPTTKASQSHLSDVKSTEKKKIPVTTTTHATHEAPKKSQSDMPVTKKNEIPIHHDSNHADQPAPKHPSQKVTVDLSSSSRSAQKLPRLSSHSVVSSTRVH